MEAAASVVGIVSFGLGLAKSLQAFIDSMIEAGETITLIVADVNHTASTLQRLQDVIDQDKAASEEEHRATVFNSIGVKEVDACALQCKRIYVQIIILIEKASMQNGEDGTKNVGSQGPAADDPDAPAMRLAAFSKNVTKLGRKMRWPWLEPRIKRLQQHLKNLKISLSLSLQVFLIAQNRSRPSVARIFGTDEESELRDRAEMLRKKLTELRAKKSSPNQPNRRPPGSDNGNIAGINATRSTSSSSSIIIVSSRSTSSRDSVSSTTFSATSSLGPDRGQSSVRSRRPRIVRAMKSLLALKVHMWNRAERTSLFKDDLTSVTFEAYLIYPGSFPDPFPGESASTPLIKLPFGHRRLNREVKRALRKFNPWHIFLFLNPRHRALVDRVVQQVQVEAKGITNVCLVAIDVDRNLDPNMSDFEDDFEADSEGGSEYHGLVWTRMVLFFRHEPVQAREQTTKAELDVPGGHPHLRATIKDILLDSRRKTKKRLELKERLKREREKKIRDEEERGQQALKDKVEAEIAKRDEETRIRQEEEQTSQQKQMEHDKRVADEARSQLLETQRQEEDDKRRRQEERQELEEKIRNELKLEEVIARQEKQDRAGKEKDVVESAHQALKDAEAALEDIKKGISEEDPNMSEAERVKKTLENELAKMRATEAKEAAEKAKPPVKFKDAVGRKFSFPFHLVQTWRGMEDLIKQAFLHVEVLGPHVQEGHFDLLDSKEQIILPSLWSATIEPGETVSMRMWPPDKRPLPGMPPNMTPEQRMSFMMQQRRMQAAAGGHGGLQHGHHGGHIPPMRPPGFPGGIPFGAQPPPPQGRGPLGPPGSERRAPAIVEVVDGGRPKKDKSKKAKKTLGFFSGSKPSKKRSKGRHNHSKSNALDERDDEGLKDAGKDEDLEDIDKELGLGDLEGAEEVAAKNVDELLETWTNVAGNT